MENRETLEMVKKIEGRFGIDLQAIMNDEQSSQEEKLERFYRTLLTATLERFAQGEEKNGLSADFDVQKFVDEQCQIMKGETSLISVISYEEKYAKKLATLRGGEITAYVRDIFAAAGQIIDKGDNTEAIAEIMINASIIAVGILGAAAAVVAISAATGGVATAAAVLAGIAVSVELVISFFTLLFSISAIMDKSFFGVVANNTGVDLIVKNGTGDFSNGKKNDGVRITHGVVGSLMHNCEDKQNPVSIPRQCVNDEGVKLSYVGLFNFDKKVGFLGSEGIIRFRHGKNTADMHSGCPMSNNNRMIISKDFASKNLDGSNSALIDKWGKLGKEWYEETDNSNGAKIKYTSAVMGLRGSPAYGIATATTLWRGFVSEKSGEAPYTLPRFFPSFPSAANSSASFWYSLNKNATRWVSLSKVYP